MDLARRFRGLPADAPRLARQQPYAYNAGDGERFTLLDLNAPALYTVSATVRLVTDHAYFFVEDGASFSQSDLNRIGADFESDVYPRVTAAFGREWNPGVDSDPRISIVHADLRGAGGYFSGNDEFPRAAVPDSSEREALYLESNTLGSPGPAYNSLAAHELQHLIQWNADRDEDSWVNEGLSQVAAQLLTGPSGWIPRFLASPDTQLNQWPVQGDATVHYAASELFLSYLLGRYGGRDNASALLSQQADGIAGIDAYLAPFGADFLRVFAGWVVANYLDDEEGSYSEPGIDSSVPAARLSPGETGQDTVNQFAADYLEIDRPGTFSFDGADAVSLGAPAADSGQPFWFSGRGDGIDSRLTREIDLTGLSRATLRYSAWFDTERGWDYAYVAASADGGKTWRTLPATRTTTDNPIGAAYGPGYTGQSGGWVQEEADLSPFAGGKILLRFEYVTDDAANLGGLAVDNIEVPELGFRDDAGGPGDWQPEGFLRIGAPLPQRFIVQVIDRAGGQPRVSTLDLDAENRGQLQLTGPATIVISAATDGPTEPAPYSWALSPP
jgi:immune inhibitor A